MPNKACHNHVIFTVFDNFILIFCIIFFTSVGLQPFVCLLCFALFPLLEDNRCCAAAE